MSMSVIPDFKLDSTRPVRELWSTPSGLPRALVVADEAEEPGENFFTKARRVSLCVDGAALPSCHLQVVGPTKTHDLFW